MAAGLIFAFIIANDAWNALTLWTGLLAIVAVVVGALAWTGAVGLGSACRIAFGVCTLAAAPALPGGVGYALVPAMIAFGVGISATPRRARGGNRE